ncbi:hypothetical protein [Pandoraea apista]|uniref:hypothetical protein n=1 Tax=Pandoraea apista TaxID=93218 RepID=UPI000A401A8B|nr:hypothetical protein [Pandoraea apista]
MPSVSSTAASSNSTFLHLAYEAVNCLYDGFRGDFQGASACLRGSGLSHLLNNGWGMAGQRHQERALSAPDTTGVWGATDVAFACALSALTIGAVCRYLWPEMRALENAFREGEQGPREWALQTRAQLRRRTPADVTSMRQCLAAFDATQIFADAASATVDSVNVPVPSRRKLAERKIAEILVLHIADAPQTCIAQSDRVSSLCQLLAHGLGFKLPRTMREALRVDDARPSLIRYDDAFTLLRERLEPNWRDDLGGSPTFTVHPIDVQLFDPAETTGDLTKETRMARRQLTHPQALRRVRDRVVALMAASVKGDCGSTADWRDLGEFALVAAVQRGLPCERVLDALGIAVRAGVTARFAWRWTDDPQTQPVASTIPVDVSRWLARVLMVAGKPEMREPCPPRLAALARGDTPASLMIGSRDWIHLVDGVRALGRDHWHADYAAVCEAGKA